MAKQTELRPPRGRVECEAHLEWLATEAPISWDSQLDDKVAAKWAVGEIRRLRRRVLKLEKGS